MSLDQLPEAVLLQIVACVDICDAVALAQTSHRLRELVLDAPGVHSSTLDPEQSTTLRGVLAAADQRLHAVTGGTWRDALLLAAWQRQQSSTADTETSRRSTPSPAAAVLASPLLQRVLDTPDAAAAVVAGEIPTCRSSTSSSSSSVRGVGHAGDGPRAAAGTTTRQNSPGRSTEFGLYWQPGQEMLGQTSCLVTDGRSTVLLAAVSDSNPGQVSAAAAAAAAAQEQPATSAARQARAGSRSQPDAAAACRTPQHSGDMRLRLLHGHLPPAQTDTSLQLHQLLLNPAGQVSAPSSSSSSSRSWPTHVLDGFEALVGLRHLLDYLRFWWGLAPHDNVGEAAEATAGAATAAGTAAAAENNSTPQSKQPAGAFSTPRQALLLPLAPPPGSIPGLMAPWPPQLAPGSSYQGLGAPSCDASSGSRACPRLLRDGLLYNEPALLLPAGPAGCNRLPHLSQFETIPSSWWGALCHLDLSGQVSVHDSALGPTLALCSSLKTLSIADTAAGACTFMVWPYRRYGARPAGAGAAAAAADTAGAAAVPKAGASTAAVAGLQARMSRVLSLSPQPQQQGASHSNAAADQLPLQLGRGSLYSNPRAAVCRLQVLDVSGCPALAAPVVPAAQAELFRSAVGAMPHLEVLLACRLNVDAVLVCAHDFPCASLSSMPPAPSRHPPAQSGVRYAIAGPGSAAYASAQQGASNPRPGLGAQPPDPPAGCTFCQVLSGLAELDVSAATALSAPTLALLLQGCSSLRRLGAAGCKTLGEGEGAQRLEAALAGMAAQRQQQDPGAGLPSSSSSSQSVSPVEAALPQSSTTQLAPAAVAAAASAVNMPRPLQAPIGQGLMRLAVGWGWSAGAISSVLRGAPHLISFTAGVGACVTDGVLVQLASSCQHLQRLSLALCTVTSKGVSAVLCGCPHLTSLQLQQCVGPFNGADMTEQQHHQTLCSSEQQQGQSMLWPAKPPKRWQLATLQLSGAPTGCSDAQMLQLLGIRARQPSMTAAAAAHLTELCLVRVEGLTDSCLLQLAAAGCCLQHLSLQDCRTPLAAAAGSPAKLACNSGSVQALSFSSGALLQLVGSSCALSLHSLTLRHAALLPQDFVAMLVKKAPLLQRVVLDACDLMGGFDLEPDPHGALGVVHVARCHHLDGHHDALSTATHRHEEPSAMVPSAAGAPDGRVKDKDLVVHMLNLRRSIHLPPS